jgi:ATP-binding cassette, subfamily C, bacteriocin exporter
MSRPHDEGQEFTALRQRRGNDCGLAALATVAAHHGRNIDYEDLVRNVPLDVRGTSLLALSQAAHRLEFSTQGVKGAYEAISMVTLPAIAHLRGRLRGGHFVVIHRWTASYVILADPSVGVRKLSRATFCRLWTGYLLIILPSPQ